MLRFDVINSPALLKRFCRDYNVPVSTFHPQHFENQLETLALYSRSYRNNFDIFVDELSKYDSAESYFAYYNEIKDRVITYIQTHPEFKKFNELLFDGSIYNKKELYTEENHLKDFISIDLKKANFSIINYYCPNIFEGKSWEEFLMSFGASSYIAKSKYIRQVIFGACNPKKQIQAQTALMNGLAQFLESDGYHIYSVVTDEIILDVNPGDQISCGLITNIIRQNFPEIAHMFKIESFNLSKNDVGYEKFIVGSSENVPCHSEFKCVDSDLFCQLVKYYYHKEISESDIVFDYKGSLAKFVEPISNPFKDDYLGG